ncbi:hypothetical protein J4573_29590 [Actinomadura barringtoniae]|uniref:PH domain-containing protein n=1 Tax=Actinomadura barringtoniae TaxID=1427535 RepID=A0A939PLD0_9ACTN|nr:hypothetical protein [Actinomadura barringtoniae]MBO2451279.1 hypothetical protein [Actinomadura barringtoniae]
MLRLNVGWPRGLWIFQLGCAFPVVMLAELFLVYVATMFISWDQAILGILVLVFAVASIPTYIALLAWRYGQAFWLDGRVLIRRSVTGRKHYHLPEAKVSAESVAPNLSSNPLPRLVIDQPGRPRVRLWLREPNRRGALLPPEQLTALAHAIDPTLQHPVARRLHDLASDPLGGIS